jgi:hypothetical protein
LDFAFGYVGSSEALGDWLPTGSALHLNRRSSLAVNGCRLVVCVTVYLLTINKMQPETLFIHAVNCAMAS